MTDSTPGRGRGPVPGRGLGRFIGLGVVGHGVRGGTGPLPGRACRVAYATAAVSTALPVGIGRAPRSRPSRHRRPRGPDPGSQPLGRGVAAGGPYRAPRGSVPAGAAPATPEPLPGAAAIRPAAKLPCPTQSVAGATDRGDPAGQGGDVRRRTGVHHPHGHAVGRRPAASCGSGPAPAASTARRGPSRRTASVHGLPGARTAGTAGSSTESAVAGGSLDGAQRGAVVNRAAATARATVDGDANEHVGMARTIHARRTSPRGNVPRGTNCRAPTGKWGRRPGPGPAPETPG